MLSSVLRILCTAACAHCQVVQIKTNDAEDNTCLTFSNSSPWDTDVLLDDCSRADLWEFKDGKMILAGDETMCLGLNPDHLTNDVIVMRECTEEATTWELISLGSDAVKISVSGGTFTQPQCLNTWESCCFHGQTITFGGYADCDDSDQQIWHVRSADDFKIQSTLSSMCVDLPGGDASNGALLWMWECFDVDSMPSNQLWSFRTGRLVYLPDSTKCVTLLGGDVTNGNTLGIWDCDQGDSQDISLSQQWGFDTELGTIYLSSSKASDATKCAQISGDNMGDPLVIWDCTIEPIQVWAFPALDAQFSIAAVV